MQVIKYDNGSYCLKDAPYYENTVTAFFDSNRQLYDLSMLNKQGYKTALNINNAIKHFRKIGFYLRLSED